jgi:isopenicillin-N epimerase
MKNFKDEFLIDPDIVYLNHGSFGATPKIVFDSYQTWQKRLEHQPVQFIVRELLDYLKQARQTLGEYLKANSDDLVFIPNATFGVNVVSRSLDLQAGDEVLSSDHEYGACDNAWQFICSKTGASYRRIPIPLPLPKAEDFLELLWQAISANTKVIYLSHLTSSTAQRFPVELVCKKARNDGILTIIDGAHTPGQIPLDLGAIDADFYVGNCHKWMLGPKGSGFLYTRPDKQKIVEPLVVSWGWGENSPYTTGSDYLDRLEWWGTSDPSAYLATPTAIQYMDENGWPGVRQGCNQLLHYALDQMNSMTCLQSMYSDGPGSFHQMAIAQLPSNIGDVAALQSTLFSKYGIEIPGIAWNNKQYLRISIQAYNTQNDVNVLLAALGELLSDI